MPAKNLLIFPDSDTAIIAAGNALLEQAELAHLQNRKFNVALSGGSTPAKLFKYLAAQHQDKNLSWAHVHFFWGDERMVPPEDQQSNYKMAMETLLNHLPLQNGQIHRIRGEALPAEEILRLSKETRETVPCSPVGQPIVDWIFLGMGGDGHTASLFPGASIPVDTAEIWALAEHPESGQKRITLTLPAINAAKRVVFLVFGRDKASMLNRVLMPGSEENLLPAAMVNPQNGRLDWYLDEAAAADLANL